MKTGQLMKFPSEGGDIPAHLYRDADLFRASLYVTAEVPSWAEAPFRRQG